MPHLPLLSKREIRLERLRREQAATPGAHVQAQELAQALRAKLRGEVLFDNGTRALYATDASNYRQVPIGVVLPRDEQDVLAAAEIARTFDAPILPRGGGTSLAGQGCNVALVLDFSRHMNRVLEVDPASRLARVEPGCVLDRLRDAAEVHGLTFGPDPATHSRCTIGGMLGNNSCGAHSLVSTNAGLGLRTSDNTHGLRVLTYGGEIVQLGPNSVSSSEIEAKLRALSERHADEIRARFPKLPRRVSGYNLDDLLLENGFHAARSLVGSEGTCAIVLDATLHLVASPPARVLLILGYPDVFTAGDHVPEMLAQRPTAIECFDELLLGWVRERGGQEEGLALLPPGGGFALVEFGGATVADAHASAKRLVDALKSGATAPRARVCTTPREQHLIWRIRESALATAAFVSGKPDAWEGWEDSAVAPERIGDYLRALDRLLAKFGFRTALYGHLGQGCVHLRIPFDFYSEAGLRTYREFMEEATDLAISFGGSLSGEHGDGQARGEFLEKQFGPQIMQAFREFKQIWDPAGRMNPGKKIDALPITDNLRYGPDYEAAAPPTHFDFSRDERAFGRATMRCVGVGICRRESGGTMCPSYMVTRDERHSTRGRARLLWEMLHGDVLEGGWRSEEVREALDLCLSCKGCKSECPTQVDMAAYKAEFLSHYYEGRLRPLHAYAFGFIHDWARLTSALPKLANSGFAQSVVKKFANVAAKRELPRIADETFRKWHARTPITNPLEPPVVLFPDTFTNFFQPQIGRAAVAVLEHAGFNVILPAGDICCGRPLYDYGFLAAAKSRLVSLMRRLAPFVERSVPIVVLEPSCASVFRDELLNFFPGDALAHDLSQNAFLLGDFLERFAPQVEFPKLTGHALLHPHCHQKAVLDTAAEARLLEKLGLKLQVPDAGCCGMAGAFGFEREHFDVSVACAERVLLPAVRDAADDTLIISSGFSCREQMRHCTSRTPLHTAEVLNLALQTV